MRIRSVSLAAACLLSSVVLAGSAEAATFYAGSTACGPPDTTCTYGPNGFTALGAPAGESVVSNSYLFVPPPGSGGGYSLGVNASAALELPDRWRAYAQAGGYVNAPEPFALSSVNAFASGGIRTFETHTPQPTPTWNSTGSLRFSWEVEGSVSVSYSAPGTPEQASAAVTLGFDCSYSSGVGGASRPCASPDFAPAPSGSFSLIGTRRFTSSQTVRDVFDFDVFVTAGGPVTLSMGAGVTAGLGLAAGTPVGALNGVAVGDFLNTGKLIAVTLFDSSGNVVTDAVLQSESGFNYLAVGAIPEPSATLLLAAGLMALGARWQRVRQRRT